MELTTYYSIISSESKARRYLSKKCLKNGHRFCPRCRARKLYKLADGRRRCPRCGYTFHDFSGRWIGRSRLSCVQWLSILKLFELEVSVRKTASQLGIAYNTAYKAFQTIRYAILAHTNDGPELLGGEIELDEAYCRGAAAKIPVFGILERQGRVRVTVVRDVSAETLLNMTLKTVRRGSIVYTDKFRSYDSLMFCGYRHLKVDHQKRFASGKVYINGLEGFWSWAKERLIKHHGVSKENFPLYLKELEFRYNHRQEDLFDNIANLLCDLVPDRE